MTNGESPAAARNEPQHASSGSRTGTEQRIDTRESDSVSAGVWIALVSGSFAVGTGFALFILLGSEPVGLRFLGVLLIAAVLSYGFEYLKEKAGEEPAGGDAAGHHKKTTLGSALVTLVVLGVFEMFVTAAHAWMDLPPDSRSEFSTVIFGPDLARHVSAHVNLAVLATLWVLTGVLLAGFLVFVILEGTRGKALRKNAFQMGAIGGCVVAPIFAILYLLLARVVLQIRLMWSEPKVWADYLLSFQHSTTFTPLKTLASLLYVMTNRLGGRGSVLGMLVVVILLLVLAPKKSSQSSPLFGWVALSALIIYLPFSFLTLKNDLIMVGKIVGLVAIMWGVPAIVLAVLLPYLDRGAEHQRSWGLIACGAAVLLTLPWWGFADKTTWVLHGPGALFAAVAFLACGLLWFLRAPMRQHWPLLAVSIGALSLGTMQIATKVNFLDVQELTETFMAQPLPAEVSQTSSLQPSEDWYRKYLATRNQTIHSPGQAPKKNSSSIGTLLDPSASEWIKKHPYLSQVIENNPAGQEPQLQSRDAWLRQADELLKSAADARELVKTEESELKKLNGFESEGKYISVLAGAGVRKTSPTTDKAVQPLLASLDLQVTTAPPSLATGLLETLKLDTGSSVMLREPYKIQAWNSQSPWKPTPQLILSLPDEVSSKVSELKKSQQDLKGLYDALGNTRSGFDANVKRARNLVGQEFLVSSSGALGFWLSLGMLAAWALRNRENVPQPAS